MWYLGAYRPFALTLKLISSSLSCFSFLVSFSRGLCWGYFYNIYIAKTIQFRYYSCALLKSETYYVSLHCVDPWLTEVRAPVHTSPCCWVRVCIPSLCRAVIFYWCAPGVRCLSIGSAVGVCDSPAGTVANANWPVRILHRHWFRTFSFLADDWPALESSYKNAEVV